MVSTRDHKITERQFALVIYQFDSWEEFILTTWILCRGEQSCCLIRSRALKTMHIDTAAGSLQVLMLTRNRCRGADTGSRVILVLSPRGSHHLTWVKPPGQGQHPQHLASHVSRLKRKVSSYLEWYPAQYWSKQLFNILIWALLLRTGITFFESAKRLHFIWSYCQGNKT